jgi:O-antigen ligase
LQVGPAPQTATLLVAIALLFGLVTVSTAVYVRTRRRDAWLALVVVTVLLVVLVILGSMTVGLWLVPGVGLALVAVRLGRPVQPSPQSI